MRILALETSTEFCSVALWQDGCVRAKSELVGQKHSELLLNQLDALLIDAGVRVADLDGIAFGKGPGSFTGVRIACGVTQGLALGADLPVVGVCTLLALAQSTGKLRVMAALDARMGEIYHAAYVLQDGMWVEISAPCLCKADAAPPVDGDCWFGVGSGFAAYSDALAARYAGQLDGVDAQAVPQAAAIAVLGAAEFLAGQGVDAALAQPLYLRDKVALKTAERVALGGA
ncbi:MAG: tRNA (adenosine(37)-N6)-threonylcarbamoyltransferase complex dimerization subunit type 1 TsaB [Gallionella sp.]|nr:tRNA (adenosine(37)-N6)-threonylcarbamoyltransferase complex dimerization subunit type 1 TsaB [Gallionella sp.]